MIKIAIFSIVAVILALQFKDVQEYGIYLGIIVCVIIAGFVIDKVGIVVNTIDKFQKYVSIDIMYIKLLLKMIGITYIAEIAASICKDAGYGGISKQIEIGGKFTILAISIPILTDLLDIVVGILK